MFKRRTTGQLVVKPQLKPRTKLLIIIGIVALTVVAVRWTYDYGVSEAGFERAFATKGQQRLEDDLQQQKAENDELRASLAQAQRAAQMNETAFQELDGALKASSQEIVKLREELNFYRNIISPTDKKVGLRIQSLQLEPSGANQFRYKLVLIQALKHEHTIYGLAKFEISGADGTEEKVFAIPGSSDKPIKVNFKYFQDIEGQFELPKNFKPRRIKVSVTPSSGASAVEESYPWPQA
jgi:hypothetical protein